MNAPRTTLLAFAVLAALAFTASRAQAESPAEAARVFIDRALPGMPGRVEVKVGEIDPRLNLAPCQQVEPFLPAGARLWGRGYLGLACKAGASWRVSIPVDVRVHAIVPVTIRPLRAGEIVTPADIEEKEIEVSAFAPGLLATIEPVAGRVLTRGMPAGQPLRADQFRAPQAIAAGEPVRVTLVGRGFEVSMEGKALQAGAVGDAIRVQLATGKTVGGRLKGSREIEVQL